jgi:hypothetical protein
VTLKMNCRSNHAQTLPDAGPPSFIDEQARALGSKVVRVGVVVLHSNTIPA